MLPSRAVGDGIFFLSLSIFVRSSGCSSSLDFVSSRTTFRIPWLKSCGGKVKPSMNRCQPFLTTYNPSPALTPTKDYDFNFVFPFKSPAIRPRRAQTSRRGSFTPFQ